MTTFRMLFCSLLLASAAVAQSGVQNEPEDISALRRAAEHGDAQKQSELGSRYFTGKGVAKDSAEAMKWYRKAAEQGNVNFQSNMGFMSWFAGDYAEAVKWFRRAAEQGSSGAQRALGDMYKKGQGVPQDYVQAHMWISFAISQMPGPRAPLKIPIVYSDSRYPSAVENFR